MFGFKKIIFLLIIVIPLLSRGDEIDNLIAITRETISIHTDDNKAILEIYGRLTKEWKSWDFAGDRDKTIKTLIRGVKFSSQKHLGQFRKDRYRLPYFVHPLRVCETLWQEAGVRSANVLVAALLHDTLEDTDTKEEEIENIFGPRVLYIVQEVTNDKTLSSSENKQRQIDHAPKMSMDAQLVKLADRLDNVRSLSNSPPVGWDFEKINEYFDWGEKLLLVLGDTNTSLREKLKKIICSYKNGKIEWLTQKIIDIYHDSDDGYNPSDTIFLDNKESYEVKWYAGVGAYVGQEVKFGRLKKDSLKCNQGWTCIVLTNSEGNEIAKYYNFL